MIAIDAISKVQENHAQNLLVRSLCLDILLGILLLPSQEINKVQQDDLKAKEIKIGNNEVNAVTQSNPNTSYGIFCGAVIHAKTRAIDRARFKKTKRMKQ